MKMWSEIQKLCVRSAPRPEREICCYENISLVMEEEEGWQEVVTLITPPARWPNTTLCVCVCVCVCVCYHGWTHKEKGKQGEIFQIFYFYTLNFDCSVHIAA